MTREGRTGREELGKNWDTHASDMGPNKIIVDVSNRLSKSRVGLRGCVVESTVASEFCGAASAGEKRGEEGRRGDRSIY